MRLLVIADDFTGALDTGVQFAAKGISTIVSARQDPELSSFQKQAEVLVVDTQSRHLSPQEAYRRVYKPAAQALHLGIPYLYKKTDSTLRGNIASELQAVMDAWGGQSLMFVPAYPQTGRTTLAGRQYVNGLPLQETQYAQDPLNPVPSGYIPEILASAPGLQTALIPTADKPWPELGQAGTVYIFDAVIKEDLAAAGQRLQAINKLSLTAGCAGFAEVLGHLLPLSRHPAPLPDFAKDTLVLCGSVNEHSLQQIRFIQEQGCPARTLSPEQLQSLYWDSPAGTGLLEEWRREITKNGMLVINTARSSAELERTLSAREIAASLGQIAARLLQQGTRFNLVIFGGDTAIAVMEALGTETLTPVKEILPGLALSALTSRYGETALVTKAGGFGPENVLELIRDYLKGAKVTC